MKSNTSIPWQDRASDSSELIWRFNGNPLTDYRPIPGVQGIYNSAVVPWKGKFAGIFRGDQSDGMPALFRGFSEDGIRWNFDPVPLNLKGEDDAIGIHEYAYDPRVIPMEGEDRFLICWCNGYHGPTIGLAETKDFETIKPLENAFLPYNRNGVLFPRKIRGRYAMLSRPSDTGHTPFGDIFYSESPDLTFWGHHRHVMSKGPTWWQGLKIGPGPAPIETSEGWLLLYHGVCNTCNGYVYRIGAALLDLDEPWKVRARGKGAIFGPEKAYETTGMVPNVTFPCAALQGPNGKLAIYYGAADTRIGLAFAHMDELLAYVLER